MNDCGLISGAAVPSKYSKLRCRMSGGLVQERSNISTKLRPPSPYAHRHCFVSLTSFSSPCPQSKNGPRHRKMCQITYFNGGVTEVTAAIAAEALGTDLNDPLRNVARATSRQCSPGREEDTTLLKYAGHKTMVHAHKGCWQ